MSESPLFDQAVFLELSSELGEEDAAEVLEAFLADGARKMGIMTSAMQDRSTIKREAHSIKSSAATLGFAELSALAREIEARSEAVGPSELFEFVETLARVFEQTSQLAQTQLLASGTESAR
jgi:HPt (histidine-containing phosphotransfer) domain-containing protein